MATDMLSSHCQNRLLKECVPPVRFPPIPCSAAWPSKALRGAPCPFLLYHHSLCVAAESATLVISRESCLLEMPGPSCRQGDHSDVSPVTMTSLRARPYPIRHSPVSAGVKWLFGKGHLGGSLGCAEPGLRWSPLLESVRDELDKEVIACWPGPECLCYGI